MNIQESKQEQTLYGQNTSNSLPSGGPKAPHELTAANSMNQPPQSMTTAPGLLAFLKLIFNHGNTYSVKRFIICAKMSISYVSTFK